MQRPGRWGAWPSAIETWCVVGGGSGRTGLEAVMSDVDVCDVVEVVAPTCGQARPSTSVVSLVTV